MGQLIPFLQNPEYFFDRGITFYKNKEWNRSIRYLKRAIELRPLEGVFHCQLAAILSDMGEYERSNETLLHVLDHIDGDMYDCYYFLANNYAFLGLFDKSKEAALHYLSSSPEGEFVEDAQELLELVKLDGNEDFFADEYEEKPAFPDDFILQYERAGRFINEGNYEKAERLLKGLMMDYPAYYASYNQYARTLHLQGRSDEAMHCLRTLLEEVMYVPALCQLTLLLEDQRKDREVEQLKKKLRQLVPLNKGHIHKLAATLCRLGEYEQALLLFHFLQKHSPPEMAGAFFYRYGVAAFHCGYHKKSKKAWKLARDHGDDKAATLLQAWQTRALKSDEVQCEHLHDLSFGLD
ncbi:tetratricopeptide repeat protein [Salicibibacter cibi]|uniref:Tetratricopeptide repeat protein n=1 Tax=Salicibibacter cibi TaxID=2743001 RepID=A0A7T7CGZ1_9BACI|nr:tetratricopeptide repeat protein [Salicibibacter cibi]QQK81539.1 tetratricopeptide repeat protein [Salicibibacter cibi]